MLPQDEKYYLPNTPPMFAREDINRILKHVVALNGSDLHIAPNMVLKADIHGRFYAITKRRLVPTEVENFIKQIYGDNATAQLNSGKPIDCSHSIPELESEKRIRFRVNAVKILSEGRAAIQITIRTIMADPPTLESLNLEPEIWDNFRPDQGIIMVTGPTGSGKSTLLAGCIRGILEDPESFKKIVTYEAPIEFTYEGVDQKNNMIFQTEVPTYLPDFFAGVETSMRRKPNIILIGEARDPETIRSSIIASQAGQLVYTTAHTNGVANTLRRMVNVFSSEERESLQYDLLDSVKMVISQRLLPTIDQERCAIREFLVFDEKVKERLIDLNSNLLVNEIKKIVKEKEQSLADDVMRKFHDGIISEKVMRDAVRSYQ